MLIDEQNKVILNVLKSFYCNNEYNFIEMCGEMCDVCKDLQD